MDNTIMSIINTIQARPITTTTSTSSTSVIDFKTTINERITEVRRIDHAPPLTQYHTNSPTSYETPKTSHEQTSTETPPSSVPCTNITSDQLIYSSLLKQLLLTKAIDPSQKWVDQNKVRKAYDLD